MNNFIWTNRKVETKLYLLLISPNKIFQQENNNILDEILFSLFGWFKIRSQGWEIMSSRKHEEEEFGTHKK